MACAGIDFGSRRSVVAIARRGGVDICCNEVSNRATPSLVSFAGAQRFVGEAAVNYAAQNPTNTVGALQRLLGASFASPLTKREAERLGGPTLVPTPAGGVAVEVQYDDGSMATDEESKKGADGTQVTPTVRFTFEALAGMLFASLMDIASAEYAAPVRDCVITVPSYYTEAQRRAVLAAATIGNVNVLRVLSEHAAVALSYGIFRTKELPDTTPVKVAFVDMGDASTTVTIAAFTNARADILSVVSDSFLGGREFDYLVANVFASQFKEKYKMDVMASPRPRARLLKEAEKIKRVLSANSETRLNIECLMNDVDVTGKMTREEFEQLSLPLIESLKQVCARAIAEANLAPGEKLLSVEIIGAATRIPAVKAAVEAQFEPLGAQLKTTLNMDECVARGAALMSAILSPAFKVRDYAINDIAPYAIDAEKIPEGGQPEVLSLIPKYQTIPCLKKMTFKAPGPVTIRLAYKNPSSVPQGETGTIAAYKIDAPIDPDAKVRAKIRVTANGIIEMAGAQLSKEVETLEDVPAVPPVPASDEASAAKSTVAGAATPVVGNQTGSAPLATNVPVPMAEDLPSATPPVRDGSAGADTATDCAVPSVPMDDVDVAAPEGSPLTVPASATVPAGSPVAGKRLVKKTQESDLPVVTVGGVGVALSLAEINAAVEVEAQMKASDLYIKERSEALNGLESYVYDLRSRIDESGDLKDFGPESVRVPLKAELDEAEEWIYSEDGDKASKSAFVARKESLVSKAAPMLTRKREHDERPVAVSALESTLEGYKQIAVPTADEYAHIEQTEKNKVLKCVEQSAVWLKAELAKQEKLGLDVDPVLTCSSIRAKRAEVDRVCGPIKKTPKPVPKVEKPAEGAVKEGTPEAENAGKPLANDADKQSKENGTSEADVTVDEPECPKSESAKKSTGNEASCASNMEWEKPAPDTGMNGKK
jgi:heat shock 70kDa protein 4